MLLDAVIGMARAVPLDLGYRLADACSRVHHWAAPGRRHAVERNLRVLGLEDPGPAVRSVFRNYGRTTFEFLRGPGPPEVPVELVHLERLRAALDRGRGVILAAAHTGNWGRAAMELSARGLPIAGVADIQLRREWTEALRERQRRHGLEILPPAMASWRRILELLARNQAVALLVDGNVFRGGLPLVVHGHRVRFPGGPAKLALRTGAPLLPAWAIRREDGSIQVDFGPELPAAGSGPDAVRDLTHRLLEALLEHVRRDPGQWLIFRPFFEPIAGDAPGGAVT